MSAVPMVAEPAANRWISGRASDLLWVVLCPIFSLALLHAVWRQGSFSDRNLYAVMFCFVATAHHMPACLRAFGEPVVYQRYRGRLWTALLCMPLMAVAAFAGGIGVSALCVVALFDLWHVAMQQHGLGRIYGAKAGERDPATARLDLACTLTWYAAVVIFSDSWMAGLAGTFEAAGLPVFDGLTPGQWQAVRGFTGVLSLVLGFAYVRNALRQWRTTRRVPVIKVALHAVGFLVLAVSYQDANWYRAQSTQNLFHALQYFFIVWVYAHLAVRKDPLAYPHVYAGLFLHRRGIMRFMLLVLLYGLFFYILRAARTGLQLGVLRPSQIPGMPARWTPDHAMEMLMSVSVASLFLHFYVDSFIWKVRSGPVRSTLGLAPLTPASPVAAEPLARGAAHALGYFGLPLLAVALLARPGVGTDESRLRSLRHDAVLFPDSAAAQSAYGIAALEHGDPALAEPALARSVALSPSYQGPARALWKLAREHGQGDAALRWGQAAIQAQPEDAELRFEVAMQMLKDGDRELARAQLERVLAMRPRHAGALAALRDLR